MNLFFTGQWYRKKATWALLLWPVEWLFRALAALAKRGNMAYQWQPPCPLIVVGNISVGGTGKSPLTIALIEQLSQRGYKVGVVSRGYGAVRRDFPFQVHSTDNPDQAADEPLMIVKRTNVKLVIDPNRVSACEYLLAHNQCDLIISDDGLQHYKMGRDIEIAVIDATRGLGNGHCLPVGPLREPPKRLNTVDFVMLNGITEPIPPGYHCMQLAVDGWYGVSDNHSVSAEEFKQISDSASGKIHAIAGIGNPQRFYSSLQAMQLEVQEHSFADHYQYCSADFEFVEGSLILMTEKDAVKCRDIVPNNSYYLKVSAILEPQFIEQLCTKLSNIKAPQEK